MSTTATIPVTSDYLSVTIAGVDNVRDLILVGNYLYGCTQTSPAMIVRINKANLDDYTAATFANDGIHINAIDMVYVPSQAKIYVTFLNAGRLLVTSVSISSITTHADVINEVNAEAGTPTLATDDAFLYVFLSTAANAITIWQYDFTFSGKSVVDLSAYRGSDGMVHSGGFLYFVGWPAADEAHPRIYKVSTTTLAVASSAVLAPVPSGTIRRGHHMAALAGKIYFLSEEDSQRLWRFDQSDLEVTAITKVTAGDHVGLMSDGAAVWDMLSTGAAIRIADDLSFRIYTLNSGQGYISEIAGDGTYLYAARFQAGTLFSRYRIGPTGGSLIWVTTVASSLNDFTNGLAVDSGGNILATGSANGGIFLNKYGPGSDVIWSKGYILGGAGTGVAVDSSDNVYLSGAVAGMGTGYSDVLIHKYPSGGGDALWAKRFSGPTEEACLSVAVGPDGNPVITGFFYATIDFGGTILTSAGGSDIFLVKLSSVDGSTIFAYRFGEQENAQNDIGYGVACANDGSIYLCGQFGNSIDFGNGTGTLTSTGLDAFLVKFNSSGVAQWSKRIGGALNDTAYSCATFYDGSVVVCGSFRGTANFGGGNVSSTGNFDIFVAKYAPDGTYVWAYTFGGNFQVSDYAHAVAVDLDQNVVFTGMASGDINFGGGVVSLSGNDVYVVKLRSDGSFVWVHHFGDYSLDRGAAIAVDSSGSVIAGGQFYGNVDFGGITKPTTAGGDAYILKLGA